ncbi:hypothetical protein EUTSA_v10002910mg [Eutrema salsugineum]|uniref:Retrotransposon gag domain-containing protein n=1 Tax=Eutrema salsugineum TaxID=72664 RepID=V4KHS8_EUTSA|nr:hypothetical protein EUTSA_v10002910mg [Eutrema salsugineum]
MLSKKSIQVQRDELGDVFWEVFAEFQQDLRNVVCTSVEAALRAALAIHNRAPPPPRGPDRVFVENEEEDIADNNLFAQNQGLQDNNDAVVVPKGDKWCWKHGFRLELPEFSGGSLPKDLVDWINKMEEISAFKEVPDQMRVPLVATQFRDHASAWWQKLKEQRIRAGKPGSDTK